MVTSEQIRAARALLRWSARVLAERSSVHITTILRMERAQGDMHGRLATLRKVQAALEAAGVKFTEQKRDNPGIRLRQRRRISSR